MSERDEITCAELADVAAELALGVLTGRERARAVAHLEQCDDCREEVRQLMATGEQLLELLPPAEPPAGFETRVLARLGLPVPAGEPAPPGQDAGHARLPAPRKRFRSRRLLAAAAVIVAVVGAGFGGWRIGAGAGTSPGRTAALPLTSARLLSADKQTVGNVFLYAGKPRWLYMSVDLGSGSGSVTCQLVGADGRVTTVGTFRLTSGSGGWASSDPGNASPLREVRLVSATGTVLATASLSHW